MDGVNAYGLWFKGRCTLVYTMAFGSLMEVLAQLEVACELEYLSNIEFENIELLINKEAKILSGLVAKRNSLNLKQ